MGCLFKGKVTKERCEEFNIFLAFITFYAINMKVNNTVFCSWSCPASFQACLFEIIPQITNVWLSLKQIFLNANLLFTSLLEIPYRLCRLWDGGQTLTTYSLTNRGFQLHWTPQPAHVSCCTNETLLELFYVFTLLILVLTS